MKMEFTVEILGSIEEHCFACLGSEDFVENIIKNHDIQELFRKTFNLKLDISEGFPKYFCGTCQGKLIVAAEFLAQVRDCVQHFEEFKKSKDDQLDIKEEENISVDSQSVDAEPVQDDSFANYSNDDHNSDSDNEPLIKFVPKDRGRKHTSRWKKNTSGKKSISRKKNTFNPKLERIPLGMVEEAIKEYRDKCKENSNCVLCDFKGLNIRNLSCHMIFKHKEEKNDWCLRCNMMVEDIENHKKKHTNKIWCKFCKKDVTRCHYMEHLKSHAGLEFPCEKCPKKFISKKSLAEHMARHKKQKPFLCHVCKKAFKLLKSLEDHVLTHGRYKCEVCDKNFEIPELLASHLCTGKIVKKDIIDFPPDSPKKIEVDDGLEMFYLADGELAEKLEEEDMKIENDVKHSPCYIKTGEDTIGVKPEIHVESLTCNFCQRTYKTAYKLQKHIEAHMGIFLAKCQYCDKGFSSKADLTNHERVHTKEKPFICSTCGKGFVSGATLRVHMKQHTGKTEKCELCHKMFCRKSELKLHLQKHRGERPFLCTDCGQSFAQKSHLTCHLTMHSDERPYSCIMCDKSFKKKELMKHHMRLHGEKKFKCTVCFYECHKNYRLQQHMKMHEGKTGIKMNTCQLCTRSFSSVQLLNIHMGNVHNVIV